MRQPASEASLSDMGKRGSDYLWAPGEEPPTIQDHSLAKHEVLARYLRTYIDVLTTNLVIDRFRITLVDGFAGGGTYRTTKGHVHLGSPLQMVHAMKEAELAADAKRTKDFHLDAEFFFVEQSKRNMEVLEASIRLDRIASDYQKRDRIHLLRGVFERRADDILNHIEAKGRTPRAIFLLDQYGYSKVPLVTLREILTRLPNAEILLTFATDWLIDYMSGKGGVSPDRLNQMGLTGMADQFERLISHKEHRDSRWRRLVQSVLHRDLVERSGAKYFTPFFIVSPRAHREYWFVHLSRHARARDEMTRLHWSLKNRFAHYGRNGLGMLGYDPKEDVLLSRQEVLDFSDDSEERLLTRLAEQIPSRLHPSPSDGVTFSTFFDSVCNETPATSDQLEAVLRMLSHAKEVEVVDANSHKIRGKGVQIRPNDRLRVPSQLNLFIKR